jgi:hypothetical protein
VADLVGAAGEYAGVAGGCLGGCASHWSSGADGVPRLVGAPVLRAGGDMVPGASLYCRGVTAMCNHRGASVRDSRFG